VNDPVENILGFICNTDLPFLRDSNNAPLIFANPHSPLLSALFFAEGGKMIPSTVYANLRYFAQ